MHLQADDALFCKKYPESAAAEISAKRLLQQEEEGKKESGRDSQVLPLCAGEDVAHPGFDTGVHHWRSVPSGPRFISLDLAVEHILASKRWDRKEGTVTAPTGLRIL